MSQEPGTKSLEEKGANVTEAGFKKLKIWQKGMEIAKEVYPFTRKFPEGEKFCLVSQMRRAAISIPSNLAEGYARKNEKEFK